MKRLGVFRWFAQIVAVTVFNLQHIQGRLGAHAVTVTGVAGVVAVSVAVLAMDEGFRATMTGAASLDSVIVLRGGANTEMTSSIPRDQAKIIGEAPGVARTEAGPVASAELFVVVDRPRRSTGTDSNVVVRGVGPRAPDVRRGFRLQQGVQFEPGAKQVIAGAGAVGEFTGLEPNSVIEIGDSAWKSVGVFSAGGSVAESELWTDAASLQGLFGRSTFQSVRLKLDSPTVSAFRQFRDTLQKDPRLSVRVLRERDYYREQSNVLHTIISVLGTLITFLMVLGAAFGAVNTMYSAVSARAREIATLRALGFTRGAVLVSVLAESMAVALVGGVIGAALAYFFFDGYRTATLNWQTFSQVVFAFRVTPDLLIQGTMLSLFVGFVGGLLPGLRASRLPVAAALRQA